MPWALSCSINNKQIIIIYYLTTSYFGFVVMSSSSDEQAPAEGKPAVSGNGAETSGVQSGPQVAVAGSRGGQVSIVLDASAVDPANFA